MSFRNRVTQALCKLKSAVLQVLPGAGDIENPRLRALATILVFVPVYLALLFVFRPDLMLSPTTTAGGDTGAHNYIAKFLIENLLPRFRVTGWTLGWFAGMPMLTFYFPFPFLLMAVLKLLLPYNLAFKFVTALGTFLLPVAAYAFGRLFRLPSPFSHLAAVFSTFFLFMESFAIYGGNILSTLAGEFGFSLSFALLFIFLGALHRGMEDPQFDSLFVANALILSSLVLSHILTTIMLVLVVPSLIFLHRRWKSFFYMVAVFLLAFLLTAFWGLPFLDKIFWTPAMVWKRVTSIKDIFPTEIRPLAAVGFLGVIVFFARRDFRLVPIAWLTACSLALTFLLPDGRFWNARVLPFLFIAICFWAAYGACWLSDVLERLLERFPSTRLRLLPRLCFAPAVSIVVVSAVLASGPKAAAWAAGNYSGFESKQAWPQYREILDYMDSLPQGRVMFEHDHDKTGRFGTSRAFELMPYWTKQPSMEGLLAESSITAPFHFINQAELSVVPGSGIAGLRLPPRNTSLGITHLQLMGVSYLITSSSSVTNEVMTDGRAQLLRKIGDFSIFEIKGAASYVEVAKFWPVRIRTKDWFTAIRPWYLSESALRIPILWDRGEAALQQFELIDASRVTNPPAKPVRDGGDVTLKVLDNERLVFETSAVGKPHLIRISYFPNWRAQGADGPFVVSPSFMMVIPRQRVVTLTYEPTLSDRLGVALTALGWLAIAFVLARLLVSARSVR